MKLSFQFVISLLIILSLCSSICCAFASRFSLFNKKMSEQLVCCCVASCYSDVLLLLFQLVALGSYAHTHASNGSYPSTYSIPSIFLSCVSYPFSNMYPFIRWLSEYTYTQSGINVIMLDIVWRIMLDRRNKRLLCTLLVFLLLLCCCFD